MTKQQDSGQYGEELAVAYLQDLGYSIVCVNWRHRYWEVDIIAKDQDVLVFVEVKSRSKSSFGKPSDFVDAKKQQNLIQAADAYIEQSGFEGEIRFDIVSVYLETNNIELIKDAFWSN